MPQKIVMLDAVGTTIYPKPSVVEAYFKVGIEHQISISKTEIKERFFRAVEKHFSRTPGTYEHDCSDDSDRQLWIRIVRNIFGANFTKPLFEDLWNYFAQPSAWSLFSDAVPLIENLQANEFTVGIASNFDSRLDPIIKSLLPMIPDELVFYSTGLGFAKPDVRFFKTIEARIQTEQRPQFLMIGDNWSLDVEAAKRCGWNAWWKSGEQLPNLEEIRRHF